MAPLRSLTLALLVMLGALTGSHAARGDSPAGALSGMTIWADYKSAFIRPDGRVVDNVNGGISHSEGQGYGMILALAAGDRSAFARIYAFASATLGVREDALFAWRYDPREIPAIQDMNNASDGDLLIAWALLEADAIGWGEHYGLAGRAILADLRPLIVEGTLFGTVLLPAEFGFVDDQGNMTVNPSYWVYPAFERLFALTGDSVWRDIAMSGASKQRQMSGAFKGLVPDWLTIYPGLGSAGFSPTMSRSFGYEAIRVPLYSLWSETVPRAEAARMVQSAQRGAAGRMQLVDLSTGAVSDAFVDPGYAAIAHLSACAVSGEKLPETVKTEVDGNYYPATLQLLSLVAAQTRYPQCM